MKNIRLYMYTSDVLIADLLHPKNSGGKSLFTLYIGSHVISCLRGCPYRQYSICGKTRGGQQCDFDNF